MKVGAYFINFTHDSHDGGGHQSDDIVRFIVPVAHTISKEELSPFKSRSFEYKRKEWKDHLALIQWYMENSHKLWKPFLCCNYSEVNSTEKDTAYQVTFFDKEHKQRNLNFHLLENNKTKILRFRRYE